MIASKKWMGFRSVLCPIDFSENSRLALRYAAAVAARGRAALSVMYVNDPLLVAAAAAALHDRRLATRSAQQLREFIEATFPAGERRPPRLKSHVAIGDPATEILKAAVRGRADLIVLGTHGLTGADRLLLGSTTLSVLQRSAVPVLAIPHDDWRPMTGPFPSWPGERIVAAIEVDGGARKEMDVAARLAEWFGSSLLLVHVVEGISPPAWLNADLSAQDRIRMTKAQQQLDALVRRGKYDVTEARVVCGRVADEIAAVAASERTGLLITALRDRRGWFGARRGSISYHVLTRAIAPVLACPPRWRPR
jgi:nucleotide-binding universal stress UspA family protein